MFTRWFSRKKAPAPVRRTTFIPQIEVLERRETPSVSSLGIHSVAGNFGYALTSATFYLHRNSYGDFLHEINNYAHADHIVLNSLDYSAPQPHSVQSFSAGLDLAGHANVFVQANDTTLWQFTEGQGWRQILGPNQVVSFAAVKGGRLYAQFTDNSLRLFDTGSSPAGTWYVVPGSGPVQALDAVTDNTNNDAVFLKLTDGTFREFYHGFYQQLAGTIQRWVPDFPNVSISRYINTPMVTSFKAGIDYLPYGHFITIPMVTSFSAGLDMNGQADVFAQFYTGELKKNVGGTWTVVAAAGTYKQFSATDHEFVWVISSNNTLQAYDNQGGRHDYAEPYNTTFVSLSAARSDDVFVVNQYQQLQEWNAGGWGWLTFTQTVQM